MNGLERGILTATEGPRKSSQDPVQSSIEVSNSVALDHGSRTLAESAPCSS